MSSTRDGRKRARFKLPIARMQPSVVACSPDPNAVAASILSGIAPGGGGASMCEP